MRDIEIGIGTCLTVLLTDLVTEQIIEMLSHLKIANCEQIEFIFLHKK